MRQSASLSRGRDAAYPGGAEADRQMWNDTFRKGAGFSKAPNRLLVEAVAGVAPSTALDVLMGQAATRSSWPSRAGR